MAVGEDKESDDSPFDDDDDCINIFAPFAQKSTNITEAWKTEIINYTKLDQAPVDVDILEWWKTLENSFKNLSRMAKDIFSICAVQLQCHRKDYFRKLR
uniref:Dimer_Tnp_hAT domain-containing protein n=1 Tax=Rhodnius prolixus TaxID=13249 RepID=T1HNS3_RHOPR